MLYVPGNDARKIRKAVTLGVDCVCLDLEDGVAFNRKQDARQTILKALQQIDFVASERLVRINPVELNREHEDLMATIEGRPDGYVLPKVESAEQVLWFSKLLTSAERARGWPIGAIRILVIVETVVGIKNVWEIAGSSQQLDVQRLDALLFGAMDLAAQLGVMPSLVRKEPLSRARCDILFAAKAFDLQALDMVFQHLDDFEGLNSEAFEGAQMGWDGKQIIHPNHVALTQKAFLPSDEAIAEAQKIINLFESVQDVGAFRYDDHMIDMPVLKAARKILSKACA